MLTKNTLAKAWSRIPEFQNAKQYVEGTKNFFSSPPAGTLTKTRPNGDTLFYNQGNNTFGVQAADGAPRTMFRPSDGIKLLEQAMSPDNTNYDLNPCPCCGALVITTLGEYEICYVCKWEDDPVQSAEPEYAAGANQLTLNQAKKEWDDKLPKL